MQDDAAAIAAMDMGTRRVSWIGPMVEFISMGDPLEEAQRHHGCFARGRISG